MVKQGIISQMEQLQFTYYSAFCPPHTYATQPLFFLVMTGLISIVLSVDLMRRIHLFSLCFRKFQILYYIILYIELFCKD